MESPVIHQTSQLRYGGNTADAASGCRGGEAQGVMQQELKDAEVRFEQFVKLKEVAMLDDLNQERLTESMGDNVKRRSKMEKALREIEKVLQEVVKVGSLVELCMEKVVEEEITVAELPFTLQEKVSRWPDLSKMETEEKINKMFRLLEEVVGILMIQQ